MSAFPAEEPAPPPLEGFGRTGGLLSGAAPEVFGCRFPVLETEQPPA